MTIQVRHYGLHRSESDVLFLHQPGGQGKNFIGLSAPSPFEVVFDSKKKPICPHKVELTPGSPDRNHWEMFLELYNDPLVLECLPIPKIEGTANVVFVDDTTSRLHLQLTVLAKLSSPVIPLTYSFKRMPMEKVLEALSVTNLAPLILTDVQTSDQRTVNELVRASVSLPRKLILVGDDGIVVRYPMRRIHTGIDLVNLDHLITLPMETIGSVALRRYARNEQINTPITRKEN